MVFIIITFEHFFFFVKVKIMANDTASLERAKSIISGLTMVPAVGDIYRYEPYMAKDV